MAVVMAVRQRGRVRSCEGGARLQPLGVLSEWNVRTEKWGKSESLGFEFWRVFIVEETVWVNADRLWPLG